MFSFKIRTVYIIISRAENERRLDLRGSTGIKTVLSTGIKTVYDSMQSNTRV